MMRFLAVLLLCCASLPAWAATPAGPVQYNALPNCVDSAGQHLNYTLSSGLLSCGNTGGGGSTTITLSPGLTSTIGTQNTGTQTVTNGSTLSPQSWPKPETSNYTLDTSSTCVDTGVVLVANGSASINFLLPSAGGTCGLQGTSYTFSDGTGHGYQLTTVALTTDFVGLGPSATSYTVPAYGSVICTSDGTANWVCQGGALAVTTSVCQPSGAQYQVLIDNGTGGCAEVSGLGTSGFVLTSNGPGAAPTMQSAGGSSSPYTQIATSTVTAGSAITLTGLAASGFNRIDIHCYGLYLSATGNLLGEIGQGAGPTWVSSGLTEWGSFTAWVSGGSVDFTQGSNLAAVPQVGNYTTSAATAGYLDFLLYNAPNSTVQKMGELTSTALQTNNSAVGTLQLQWIYTTDTNPITAYRLVPGSGTITGTCTAIGSN